MHVIRSTAMKLERRQIVIRNSRLTIVLLALGFASVLLGCEPSPGRVTEERSKRIGSLEIVIKRHAEGTWGNAANGEHYRTYCRSPETKDLLNGELTVSYDYRISPYFINSLPIERVTIVNEKIAFGNVAPYYFFCIFDGCASGARAWHFAKLPPALQSDLQSGLDAAVVPFIDSMIYLPPNGIRLNLNPKWFKDGKLVQVASNDQCKTWDVAVNARGLKNGVKY